MAIIYDAQLDPSKADLVAAWLPAQPWFDGDVAGLRMLAAYRFDDPDGEVGIETHLVQSGDGGVWQVPLTYRGAPLVGAERFLAGETEHSVLGHRWVYDACGDPVYAAALTAVVNGDAAQAEETSVGDDGDPAKGTPRTPSATVHRSGAGLGGAATPGSVSAVADDGTVTRVDSGTVTLAVYRRPEGPVPETSETGALVGRWPGVEDDVLLAAARARTV
ncbi:hypothetical protein DW322_14380 [Rhodococcus rhodnii]|uniref:Maltokinase N-terminal cap domain-containing protein n=2 Tax=Rhodococcus rhodnii TaxID=38312 RepID=R7WSY5_9NOCA|nr:hypothetical protein [Rhodococcus rhodnii]EOM78353.1 hypothetical protein Rrhod_0181 [Rhodococcus rhodnii LMG 5362]TXG91189.1 hypothetical protein DW322_14380 [Rhodococcus rhodnii]